MKHEGVISLMKFLTAKDVDMFSIIFDGTPLFSESYEYHIIFLSQNGALCERELSPQFVKFLFAQLLCDFLGYYDGENIMIFGAKDKLDLSTLPVSVNLPLISKFWKINRFRDYMTEYYKEHGRNVNLNSGNVRQIQFNVLGKPNTKFYGIDMLVDLPLCLMKYIDLLLGIEWSEDRQYIVRTIDNAMKDDLIRGYEPWCRKKNLVPRKVR